MSVSTQSDQEASGTVARPREGYYLTFPRTKEVSVRGFYVWVTFDDVPIPVYGEETDGAAKSAYIAVEEGQNFKVHWVDERTTAPKDSYDVCLAIDGEFTNGTVIKTNNGIFYPDVAPNDADRFMTYAGAQVSETTMRLFRFNESTAPSYNTTDRFSESGALTMSYYRAERLGDDELARRTCGEEGGKESDTEEKEVSMLGEEVQYEPREVVHVKWVRWGASKDVLPQIRFLCRSKAFLASRGFPIDVSSSREASAAAEERGRTPINAVAGPSRTQQRTPPAAPPKSPVAAASPRRHTSPSVISLSSDDEDDEDEDEIDETRAKLARLKRQAEIADLEEELARLERLKRRRQSRRSTSGVGEKKPKVEVKTEEEEREKRRKEKGKRRAFS